MPPRLNKRQQREQEELEALGGPSNEVHLSSEDEELPISVKKAIGGGSGFSALFTPEEDDNSDEDSSRPTKSRKSKKKKKVGDIATPSPIISPRAATPQSPLPKNERKATKKAKAKEKKAGKDELDKALAELSVKYPELQGISTGTSSTPVSNTTLGSLLSVSLPHLDSEAEMRKFFGAKVVQANKTTPSGPSRRQPGDQRSQLTRPQPGWWPAKQREGLSIRALSPGDVEEKLERHSWDTEEDEKWWTVEYSKKYKGMTMAFMRTVMSGDPEGFWNLLGKLPWHADTLLQLAEVYQHREEYAQAVDFVDRAIFTYERSFIGAFNFTSGTNRLDFDHVENRPFFLAIHRQIADLQRRGCVRTAFEYARLLYSLDPWNDPHGALFHLDYLAPKAGMSQWLLDVFDHFAARRDKGRSRLNPSVLPGWLYARALALHMTEKDQSHSASTAALQEAITSFPSVVPLLADKLDISLPNSIRGHKAFKIETDANYLARPVGAAHLLSHLYVQRSAPLWKEHSAWFASTVAEQFTTLPNHLPTTECHRYFMSLYLHSNPQYAIYRHVIVLESTCRRLFSFIPRDVTSAKSLACDPLPPPTSVTTYDQEFFKGVDDLFTLRARTRQERAADERRLERLIPDALFRGQLQAFFEAHPHVAERFPGGILQFAQVAGQMPEDVLEDMMLAEAMGGEGLQDRPMPGQMPGEELLFVEFSDDEGEGEGVEPAPAPALAPVPERHRVVDDTENDEEGEEDEDEEDDYVAPMPVRLLRNILGRFWGGNAVPADSSEEEDGDDLPVDRDGVD